MIFPNALHKKRKPIRRVSVARSKQLAQYGKVKREWWPTVRGTYCPVMLKIFGIRIYVDPYPHHIYGRGKYECDTSTWLACSLQGHRWIEDHKDEARKHGWEAPRGEWQNKH